MTLDTEQDRQILLEIVNKAQIVGAIAPVITRILANLQNAKVEEPQKS